LRSVFRWIDSPRIWSAYWDEPAQPGIADFRIGHPQSMEAHACGGLYRLSIGAEGNILAYVVARWFGVSIYSSVMGLLTMASAFAVARSGAAQPDFQIDGRLHRIHADMHPSGIHRRAVVLARAGGIRSGR
jgi:hypothetical protein